ncbi:hypothetical protein CBS76997_1565 [Aspergillus niger]|nr:hypothetical protein CBS13152_2845 [Aspergillus niger]KAI2948872.1 hypothetical protein CBS147321_2319 [Aspergillus niger]KAI3050977.1 hypothetical protein CBS76997_1565 [Aspergillus niger]
MEPSYQLVAGDEPNANSRKRPFQNPNLTTSTSYKITSALQYFHPFAFFSLLGICLLEASTILFLVRSYSDASQPWPASPVPPIPWISRNFTRTATMTNLTSVAEVEAAWGAYETTAFVHVQRPELYSLPPNKDVLAGTANVYMLSVHHQLHCLKQLHVATLHFPGGNGQQNHAEDSESVRHMEHCVDYLRQAILCAGDATLEGPDPGKKTLSGYGTTHQCRKWDGLNGLETWRLLNSPQNP